MKNEIILFETLDKEVSLQVQMQDETVWLTRNQMAKLFDRDVKTIGRHINNALKEELSDQVVVAKFATTTPHGAISGKTQTHMTDEDDAEVVKDWCMQNNIPYNDDMENIRATYRWYYKFDR